MNDVKVIKIDRYRDGGTIIVKTANQHTYFINKKIGTDMHGRVFINYEDIKEKNSEHDIVISKLEIDILNGVISYLSTCLYNPDKLL